MFSPLPPVLEQYAANNDQESDWGRVVNRFADDEMQQYK